MSFAMDMLLLFFSPRLDGHLRPTLILANTRGIGKRVTPLPGRGAMCLITIRCKLDCLTSINRINCTSFDLYRPPIHNSFVALLTFHSSANHLLLLWVDDTRQYQSFSPKATCHSKSCEVIPLTEGTMPFLQQHPRLHKCLLSVYRQLPLVSRPL